MKTFLLFVLVLLALLIGAYLFRVLRGPTIFDRVLGLNGISTKAIIIWRACRAVFGVITFVIQVAWGSARKRVPDG